MKSIVVLALAGVALVSCCQQQPQPETAPPAVDQPVVVPTK